MTRFSFKDAENYASSNYWVMLPDGVLFVRPWIINASLSDLHKNFKVKTSAIISACNPHSKKLSEDINRGLMAAFAKDAADKWPLFPCAGSALGGKQKSEKSWLVIGIEKEDALKLGKRYGQHAIVFCVIKNDEVIPQLLACTPSNQTFFNSIKKRRLKIRQSFPT